MSKKKTNHLNIQLTDEELKMLETVTRGVYGSKNLVIRTLLKRFFKELGLYDKPKEEVAGENTKQS